jgi:hypothetical protein
MNRVTAVDIPFAKFGYLIDMDCVIYRGNEPIPGVQQVCNRNGVPRPRSGRRLAETLLKESAGSYGRLLVSCIVSLYNRVRDSLVSPLWD